MDTCLLTDCKEPSDTRGVCSTHYKELISKGLITHGVRGGLLKESPTYRTWKNIKIRCRRKNDKHYKTYGGVGIKMCEGWYNSVHSFFHDLGARSNELSIDRIDNNGHYSCGKCDECIKNGWKKNCRWATQREQNLNKKKINKHGYPGVKLKDGRYESYIGVGCGIHKKKKYLGSFNTAKEAGRAYFDAKATLTKK